MSTFFNKYQISKPHFKFQMLNNKYIFQELSKTTTQLIHEQEQYLDAVLDAGKDASWSYMEKLR